MSAAFHLRPVHNKGTLVLGSNCGQFKALLRVRGMPPGKGEVFIAGRPAQEQTDDLPRKNKGKRGLCKVKKWGR